MSYDLMVFEKESAPKNRKDFMDWCSKQTEWSENQNYDDPKASSPKLHSWFVEMIKTFPAMNGPFANDDYDNNNVSDYSIGNDVIYVAFAWSVAEQAYKTMTELAKKIGVGFWDVSSDNGGIFFPVDGQLVPIDNLSNNEKYIKKKPWWKIWL